MQVNLLPSEFAQSFIHLKGQNFSFEGYEPFIPIYDNIAASLILKCSRQVAKTTYLANKILTLGCTIPSFASLFVSSTENHLSVFSKQKLTPALNSPYIKQNFFSQDKVDQVMYKQLSNGSDITLRSAFLDAESCRGISSDFLCIDEIQSISGDLVPIIEETLTRSRFKYRAYCGTPSVSQNPIEWYWGQSTMNEYLIKCSGCNLHNFMDDRNIKPQGLSCSACDKLLNIDNGEWVSYDTTGKSRFVGYRIPQTICRWVPWSLSHALEMQGEGADVSGTILHKFQHYPRSRFFNECLGLSYDSASCPVSLQELIECCDPEMRMLEKLSDSKVVSGMSLQAGLDWSGSQSTASYTVLVIGGFLATGKFVVVYAKRYEGLETDLKPMLNHIAKTLKEFKVTIVGADFGMGSSNNVFLRDMVKHDGIQILEINHSGTQRQEVNWNAKAKMLVVNRTKVLTEVFNKIKYREIVWPNWNQSQPFLTDLLNVYSDYNEILRTVFFNHSPSRADDTLHSLCFAHLAASLSRQS